MAYTGKDPVFVTEVVTDNLTVGAPTQDVTFTVNGATITAVISAEASGATDLGGIISHRHSATAAFGGHTLYLRSRGTAAAPTVVQSGDTLSIISSCGYDGTQWSQAAQIQVQVDGTPGATDMPGRMVFYTSPDGTQTPAEVLRLAQNKLATFSGDVTVTRASSGGQVTLANTNTSNTANSAVVFSQNTGGTSAGNNVISLTNTTDTAWSMGITSATNSSWILSANGSLGTTNVWVSTRSGEITMPLQPAFLATHTVAQTNVTGNGTLATVNFTTEVFDQGSDYDGTNTFTAPVTGRYYFNCNVYISGIDATANTSGFFQITTSNRFYQSNVYNYSAIKNVGNLVMLNFSVFADMDAADTCSVQVELDSGTLTVSLPASATQTFFGGHLVC